MKPILRTAALLPAMAVALISLSAAAAPAQAVSFSPAEEARIGQIARDYLLAHPEVLLEVSNKLQAQQAGLKARALNAAAVKYHRLLMNLSSIPVAGPESSPVVVTEFFDYECIACSMMAPRMAAVMQANPGVRFAFRDWTIFAKAYPESRAASLRGMAIWQAKGAGAYMAYHNGIYGTGHNEGKLTQQDIDTVAAHAGGDTGRGDEAKSAAMFEFNEALAENLLLGGTPGIIVMPAENATAENTTVFAGVTSPELLQAAIARAGGGGPP